MINNETEKEKYINFIKFCKLWLQKTFSRDNLLSREYFSGNNFI